MRDLFLYDPAQLILTTAGRLPLLELHQAFVSKDAPDVASLDEELRLVWTPLKFVQPYLANGGVLDLAGEAFHCVVSAETPLLCTDISTGTVQGVQASQVILRPWQLLGLQPLKWEVCPGYLVAVHQWVDTAITGYHLVMENGPVFVQMPDRPTGVWVGAPSCR